METLKQYLPLSWFVGNPLDLPRSPRFFKYALIFYYSIELFMQLNMVDDPLEAFSDVTIETLLTLLFVFVTLSLNVSLAWYVQVASALLVGESVITCFALPILAWITVTESWLSYFFLSLLLLWELLFVSFIFKHVLNINRLASLVVGIFYFIATYAGVFGVNVLLAL
jgi:hypothetical protein